MLSKTCALSFPDQERLIALATRCASVDGRSRTMYVLTSSDASEIASRPALWFQLSVAGDAPSRLLPEDEDMERTERPRH